MATRKSFSNKFKAKVAMEALKGEKIMAQISSKYKYGLDKPDHFNSSERLKEDKI